MCLQAAHIKSSKPELSQLVMERTIPLLDRYDNTNTLTYKTITIQYRVMLQLRYTVLKFYNTMYSVNTVQSDHVLKSNRPNNRRCKDVVYHY